MKKAGAWPIAFGLAMVGLFVVAVLWRRDVKELQGLNKAPAANVIAASPASAATPAAPASREQWIKSVAKVLTERDTKTDGQGVSTFTACFDQDCSLALDGKRDSFRKVRHFFGRAKEKQTLADLTAPRVKPYVALVDCRAPALFLAPGFARREWLFMDKVSMMSNGEVVFERAVIDASRDNGSGWVFEDGNVLVEEAREIEALRAISTGGAVVVRLSGQKGYVTLEQPALQRMQANLRAALAAYDLLARATADTAGESCA